MDYHSRKSSVPSPELPVIQERRKSKRKSTRMDEILDSPEVKKLEAYYQESLQKKQRLSLKFKLFRPLIR